MVQEDSTPIFLTALGKRPLPERIEAGGNTYTLARVFKNDFFAVTSLYEGPSGRVVLKINRQAWFFIVPLRWIGRRLVSREINALQLLDGVAGVPRLIGRWEDTGLVREFIEGEPLRRGARVDDDFHGRLRGLIDTIHECGMAYVDLEKCENVLVGADGKPYLFDFQIAWLWPRKWGGELWPLRSIRRLLQRGDLYHLVKLQRRTRPDQLSPEALAASYRKPWYVRIYSRLTRPLTLLRRFILDRIAPRRAAGERGRIAEQPKDAG
jgi:hypothetical protein